MDVIRGLAICGIVFPNLLCLLDPDRYFVGVAERWPDPPNRAALALVVALFAGKMMPLLAILFGIGIAWQTRKLRRLSQSPRRFLFRRFLALSLLGAAHYILLFEGDVLTALGITGLLAAMIIPSRLFQRIRSVVVGLGSAVLVVVFCMAVLAVAAWATDFCQPLLDSQTDEPSDYLWRWYLYGTYLDTVYIRLFYWDYYLLSTSVFSVAITLPLALVGAVFYQSGTWRVAARSPRKVVPLFLCVMVPGVVLETLNLVIYRGGAQDLDTTTPVAVALLPLASPVLLSVAYALGLRMLFSASERLRRFTWFQYVGRFALSAYVLQNLVLGLLFYGYGGGLMETTGPLAGIGIAVVLNALVLLLARAYSRRFRYGPLEWVWRVLSYGRKNL